MTYNSLAFARRPNPRVTQDRELVSDEDFVDLNKVQAHQAGRCSLLRLWAALRVEHRLHQAFRATLARGGLIDQ